MSEPVNHQWRISPTGETTPGDFPLPAGLMVGYSIFTTFRVPIPPPFLLLHWQRLKTQSALLEMTFPWTFAVIQNAVAEVQAAFPEQPELTIRLTVVPQWEQLSQFFAADAQAHFESQFILTAHPYTASALPDVGLRLLPVAYERSLPLLKHGDYLQDFRHRRDAIRQGFDDVLWLNVQGHVSEASTSNFFCLKEGALYTPDPERDGCLFGITRFQVVRQAEKARLTLSREPLTLPMVEKMDAAFLTNAVQGLRPVAAIGDSLLPWGRESLNAFANLASRVHPVSQSALQSPEQAETNS